MEIFHCLNIDLGLTAHSTCIRIDNDSIVSCVDTYHMGTYVYQCQMLGDLKLPLPNRYYFHDCLSVC